MMSERVEVILVNSTLGQCLYINGYRVAGPKSLGGGQIVKRWQVKVKDLERALVGTGGNR